MVVSIEVYLDLQFSSVRLHLHGR